MFSDTSKISRGSGTSWGEAFCYFTLTAFSGYENTLVSAEQLGFTYYAGGEGTLEYLFTRTLSGDIFAAHTYNEYLDTDDDRVDNVTRAGAGIDWQVLGWLGTRLEYTYRTLNSTIDENEYTENRVFLEVILRPERPYSFGR